MLWFSESNYKLIIMIINDSKVTNHWIINFTLYYLSIFNGNIRSKQSSINSAHIARDYLPKLLTGGKKEKQSSDEGHVRRR